MKKITLKGFLLVMALLPMGFTLTATDRNVAVGGNDSGNCTTGACRTVHYAVSQAQPGDTVRVAAGTYTFGSQLNLPVGIHLVGADSAQTIFKFPASMYYDPTKYPASPYEFGKTLIWLDNGANTTNQVLKKFQIDGASQTNGPKQGWGGIYVDNRSKLDIHHVKIRNTYFMGIWLSRISNSSLHDSKFENCAWGSRGFESGAIQVSSLTNTDFYNLTILEGITKVPYDYGYGMKAAIPDTATTHQNVLTNVKLYNSKFTCNPQGVYADNAVPPNIAVEWHSAILSNCEIYGNTFNNNVSLVNNVSPNEGSIVSVWIHDNDFIQPPLTAGQSYYALELAQNHVEIDHNYFNGGKYGIYFPNKPGSFSAKGWKIHHNTFYHLDGPAECHLLRAELSLDSVAFYNNTSSVARNNDFQCFYFNSDDSTRSIVISNIKIKNNIFFDSDLAGPSQVLLKWGVYQGDSVILENIEATNNMLYNVTEQPTYANVTYDHNITDDPKFIASGEVPDPYLRLQDSSACRDTGVYVGFPYTCSAPDIGAYEWNGACATTTDVIDFSTQASGQGPMNNNLYTNVAGVAVTFSQQIEHTDMGGQDHSSGSDNRMGFFPTVNPASVTFSGPVQVPSLWINTLVYGSCCPTITGKRNGSQVWRKDIPIDTSNFGKWIQVVEGAGIEKQIDEIVFTGLDVGMMNYGLDDITIVNTAGGSPGGRIGTSGPVAKTMETEMKVYPNPVRVGEPIRLSGVPAPGDVTIMDLAGRVLRSVGQTHHDAEISTNGLSSGVYLVKFQSGGAAQSMRVIIVP